MRKHHVSHGSRNESKTNRSRHGTWDVAVQAARAVQHSAAQRSAAQEELLKGKGKRARERDPRWAVVVMSGV